MRFELLITEDLFGSGTPNIYLDTFQDESISLNFNIADISDISNKNSSYSKTIKLPDTGTNRKAFSDIFNIESTSTYFGGERVFNPNKKVKCLVLRDTLEIFSGNLQLTNISYDYDNNRHSYDVVIYSDNDNLYKNIGELYLSDLKLSRFNHAFNYDNVVGSWNNSFTDGYYYPMIDYGNSLSMTKIFNIRDFKVSIFIKIILDQIFTEAGYYYRSDFLNSDFFKRLILLPVVSNSPGFTNLVLSDNKEGLIIAQSGTKNYKWDRDIPANNVGNFWAPALATWFWNTIEANTIIYNPNNLYATSSQIYSAPNDQRIAQKIKIDFGLIESGVFYDTWSGLPNFTAGTTPKWVYPNAQGPNPDPDTADFNLRNQSDDIRIYVKREYINNGNGATSSNFTTTSPTFQQVIGNSGYFTPGNQTTWSNLKFGGNEWYSIRYDKNFTVGYNATTNLWQYSGSITTDLIVDPLTVREGERLRIFIVRPLILRQGNGIPSYYGTATGTLNEFILNVSDVKISYIFDDTVQVGNGLVNIPRSLSNIKQKDFLTSIVRMFNLFIEPSRDGSNSFIIEPRDDYYRKYGSDLDWSNKIDLSKPIDSQITSNIQNRTQYFSHKPDKDFYNSLYTQTTNTVFGEYKYEFDNEFTTGETKIETIFSATPNNLLANSSQMVIPSILSLNNGNFTNYSGGNPRILYSKLIPLSSGDTFRIYPTGATTGIPLTQSSYPYAGFSDDPFNPTQTLNFGNVTSFVRNYKETINNLYYKYWNNSVLELNNKDSRFITAYLNLNSYDINEFSFANLVFLTINNASAYYRVNKILDYDPNQMDSTKVEFIKAYDYSLNKDGYESNRFIFNSIGTTSPSISGTFNASTSVDFIDLVSIYFNTASTDTGGISVFDWLSNILNERVVNGNDITVKISELGDPTNYGIYSVTPNIPGGPGFSWNLLINSGNGSLSSGETYTFLISINSNLLNRSNYIEQSTGFRSTPLQTQIYSGVINTSLFNQVYAPNNIVSGDGNFIYDSDNIVSGLNNGAIIGRGNLIMGDDNYNIYGSRNFLLGASISTLDGSSNPSVLVGNNIFSEYEGSFVFGNNVSLILPVTGTESIRVDETISDVFIIGNNITLTQSISSNTLYIGSDTVEINSQNFITNVVGTSSFNKMIIGDLVLQDLPNNTYGKFRLNQYNPADYPGGSYLQINSPVPGLAIEYKDYDNGALSIQRNNLNTGTSQQFVLEDDSIRTTIIGTDYITESRIITNNQILRVENQVSHKILGEELNLNNTTTFIRLSDFYYNYMDFFTYSTLDIEITVRYNSGTEVGFDYLSQRAWYDGGGMSVFTATGSRVSYNNLTSPNDVQSYIDQYSSIIWGGDEPALVLYTNFGFTASFYYEINLKYNHY
jgi:hypothetical protein